MAEGWEAREGSEIRVVRAKKAMCACSRDEGSENSTTWCPVRVWGQGSLRRSILARNQGVSLGPGLTCFSRGEESEKDHWTWRVLMDCKHTKIIRHLTGSGHRSDAGRNAKTLRSNRQNKRFLLPWWPYVAFYLHLRPLLTGKDSSRHLQGDSGHENQGARQGKGCPPFSHPHILYSALCLELEFPKQVT